jgi:hypothetical protein
MSSVLGSGGDTNPFEGATSFGGLSFISLPRQPPQPPPPRLTQQPIPFRGSTKPHCAVKPSKIRDAEFGLHDATDNPAMIQVGNSYADLGASVTDTGPGQAADTNLGYKTFLNGTLVSNIVLDTTALATDTIDYVATDTWGNTATSTRTVIIEAAISTDATTSAATSTSQ